MKLVVCGLNGDHLFSGDSILADTPEERDGEDPSLPSSPPESGVFPVARLAADEEDREAAPRESGVFARRSELELDSADEEYALNLIDAEWDRLRAMPALRRIGERRRLRAVG